MNKRWVDPVKLHPTAWLIMIKGTDTVGGINRLKPTSSEAPGGKQGEDEEVGRRENIIIRLSMYDEFRRFFK